MENSYSNSYKAAGVDVTAGYKAVEMMKPHVVRTLTSGVLSGLGGFGGMFELDVSGMLQPVLVSGTDGVGTKLKIAFLLDQHDTIGIDCVAMCVNDIICCGAKPLYFLDYIAMGKNLPERVAALVSGVADGCVQAGCALIGGETAEMPGFYATGEYDIAGFAVGIVDKHRIIDESRIKEGDVLIGLASSGLHSNGFSLVRKTFKTSVESMFLRIDDLAGKTLGEELLTPTRIYVGAVRALIDHVPVHGIAHITGGGFYENIPRILPDGFCAVVEKRKVAVPPIFTVLQRTGNIPEHDMYNTFNMGIGMCIAVPPTHADDALRVLGGAGETATIIGEIKRGERGVELC